MSAPDLTGLNPWLAGVTAKYGHTLEGVMLAGSRSCGIAQPDSDWDVVLAIRAEVYADYATAVAVEQAIATDTALPRPAQGLDLFIIRPDGDLIRWEACRPGDIEDGLFGGTWPVVNGLIEGPVGDFSRFFKEWRNPPVIWQASETTTPEVIT